jgi:hypothetical protein
MFLPEYVNDLNSKVYKLNNLLFIFRGQNEGFSEEQVEMYKECFKLMDIDKVKMIHYLNYNSNNVF